MQHAQDKVPPFQRVFLMLAGAVLLVFSVAVLIGTGLFRAEIREQVLHRDGVLLTNIAQYLYETGDSTGLAELDLMELAFESSKIQDVIAVRVFHPVDRLIEQIPASLYAVSLSAKDIEQLQKVQPVIRYFEEFGLDSLFSDVEDFGDGTGVALVEVIAPLSAEDGTVNASIQYWLDGTGVAAEFARLDRYLAGMAGMFLLGGWIIFAIVFIYARHRLVGMARLLSERNRSLQKANAELAMAARTSAIGSVASHLFHGLKNPLAGLKSYLKFTTQDEEALAIADRMQSLINEAIQVIREDAGDNESVLEMQELVDLARRKFSAANGPEADRILFESNGQGRLETRKAQLLLLVLGNLVDNAMEASPGNSPVAVALDSRDSVLEVRVRDQGPGMPEAVRDRLFEPVTSTKSGGTGIGLAISAILARHIPAELELAQSDKNGTEFLIRIPL